MEKIIITGVSGEVGFGLIKKLKDSKKCIIIAIDIKKPDKKILGLIDKFYKCDITDQLRIQKIFNDEGKIDIIFHLASILSTGGEKNPDLAIDVNIIGTINLLRIANLLSLKNKKSVKFIFPSSIAAHGEPITIYGIGKLACEKLGTYYSNNYKLLDKEIDKSNLLDFRCVRFPGLLSPDTLPSGGTSDYGPEMLHFAAQSKEYNCFVRPKTTIPFMAMADAIDILLKLASAKRKKLTQKVYEIGGFSVSAKEIRDEVKRNFPNAKIKYKINIERQRIVDSWPQKIDSKKAIKDWGYSIKYNFKSTFVDYLIPKIKERYR